MDNVDDVALLLLNFTDKIGLHKQSSGQAQDSLLNSASVFLRHVILDSDILTFFMRYFTK
jgi:hypothetical protein